VEQHARRRPKRQRAEDSDVVSDCHDDTTRHGVKLKWVRRAAGSDEEDCGSGEMGGLVLESFELVALAAEAAEVADPEPDPELSIAAASLLASIAGVPEQQDVVVTATVPLMMRDEEDAQDGPLMHEEALPSLPHLQERYFLARGLPRELSDTEF
jgi:hypothetical protein